MDLIDKERLLALGRLNLSLLILDEMVSAAVCQLLQGWEWEPVASLVEPMPLSARLGHLKHLLKYHAERYGLSGPAVDLAQQSAEKASNVAIRRNKLIHARLVLEGKDQPALADRKTGVELDASAEAIDKLAREAWAAALGIAGGVN